jgi:hypothetical protein
MKGRTTIQRMITIQSISFDNLLFVSPQFLWSTVDYHPTFITFRFLLKQVLVIASGLIYDHHKLQPTAYWVFDFRKIWYIAPN